jgi:hypothetical protein
MVKLSCRAIPLPEDLEDILEEDEFIQRNSSCTIFLGFTSNMVSAGIRDTIRFLVQHHMVRLLMVVTSEITVSSPYGRVHTAKIFGCYCMEILCIYFIYACALYLLANRLQEELEPSMYISHHHMLVPCLIY